MLKKKVCLIGSFAVGKTSLVSRFVQGMFSEKYLTTVGVKIDQKQLRADGRDVLLLIWDLAGEDEFQRVQASYLRGASAFLYVADGTRSETVDQALSQIEAHRETYPGIPGILLINKYDLTSDWEISKDILLEATEVLPVLTTSAKTGENVETAFAQIAHQIVQTQ